MRTIYARFKITIPDTYYEYDICILRFSPCRFGLFKENMLKVDERNKRNGSPVHGISKFADTSKEEFEVLLGRKNNGKILTEEDAKKVTKRNPHSGGEKYNVKNLKYVSDSLPTYVNWVEAGATTPVKNQGQCGSCWAFSAAEEVESQWIMQGNSIWPFSPQQIASCVTDCYGCGGGDTVYAYEYLIGLGNTSPAGSGLGSDAFAPYIQSMYSGCSGKRCTEECSEIDVSALATEYFYTGPFATVTEYTAATDFCTGSCNSQNTTELAANMAVYGPVSICLDASEWGTYTGGVMSVAGCGGYAYKDVDHCVQLVGYNNQVASPYWLVILLYLSSIYASTIYSNIHT